MAQSQRCSPDAEIKACAEKKPLLLIEIERFDGPGMAREQRRQFLYSWHSKKPHFSICRANSYQVSTTVMNYSALVWSGWETATQMTTTDVGLMLSGPHWTTQWTIHLSGVSFAGTTKVPSSAYPSLQPEGGLKEGRGLLLAPYPLWYTVNH